VSLPTNIRIHGNYCILLLSYRQSHACALKLRTDSSSFTFFFSYYSFFLHLILSPFLLLLRRLRTHPILRLSFKAIGIAIASNAPLWVEKSLWEDLKRPASIGNAKITPSGGVRLNIESKTTKTATTRTTSTKPSLAPPVPNVAEPAWEVKSASAFQAMSPVDKVRAHKE